MKKENYDLMTQYENNMLTASTVGYSRNIPRREITKIVEVYRDETGKDYNDNPYCSGCLVNILSEIKELYDAHNPVAEVNYPIKNNYSTEEKHADQEKSEDNKVRRLRKEKNDPGLDQ